MLQHIEEYGKYVEITGFKNTQFTKAEEFLKTNRKQNQQDTCLQFFNAQLIATWQHPYFAALNALLAFKNKTNISKNLAVETILYASAQRQIQKAINKIGIKPDTKNIALIIISQEPQATQTMLQTISKHLNKKADDTVLELNNQKTKKIKETYEITSLELETLTKQRSQQQALVDLIIERMALLATQL